MTTALSKSDQAKLQQHLEAIDKAKAGFNDSVVVIGRSLAAVQEILPAGDFIPWVGEHCRFSKSTAYNYIQAYKEFGSFQRLESIEPDCLYLLSRCEPAAKEAKAIASRGQIVTLERARSILDKFKDVAKRKPEPVAACRELPPEPAGVIEGELVEPEAEREPGDDTDLLKAEAAKRRNNGKELVTGKERRAAQKAFGIVTRFVDKLKRHDELRVHLSTIAAILEGKA